jgi:uncharacterized protein (TIGR02452 family)
MNRELRAGLGQDTVRLVAQGHYRLPDGRQVDLREATRVCVQATQLWTPEALAALDATLPPVGDRPPAVLEVVSETSLAGARRLLGEGASAVTLLNFASARNPGGGFLGGSQAQEESLARSSALYASLTSAAATPYYEHHRRERSSLYSDHMVLSPACPVFRDDEGRLLEAPLHVTFITSAAPNAGAVARNDPASLGRVPGVFATRTRRMMALAAQAGAAHLVLGAWGCGVFGNDPGMVAAAFADVLACDGPFRRRFDRISFSIRDSSPRQEVLHAFRSALA